MVREIIRDEFFLSRKAQPATREDLPIAQDLLELSGPSHIDRVAQPV